MTIAMPDSITPGNMPMGYEAYLGYVDGNWPTATRLPQLFPGAKVVSLTVLGGNAVADGCDCEPGDMTPDVTAEWVGWRLGNGAVRPIVYASLSTMETVLAQFARDDIPREHVRLLSAHYTGAAHICSPATCRTSDGKPITFTADGTQWTSQYPGVGGSRIDMSCLAGDFFGAVPSADWIFGSVRGLAVVNAGAHSVALSWSSPGVPMPAAVDHYQVVIRKDGGDVPSYPRTVAKGANPVMWQGGSLTPGTQYEALVRAMAVGGAHASAWAQVTFTTPG